ncbi:MAG: hypothetical protein K5931_07555 [Lachnospiraceae bacterium]|nr:hypothetical protein [Lachnospiraceae bacterium]
MSEKFDRKLSDDDLSSLWGGAKAEVDYKMKESRLRAFEKYWEEKNCDALPDMTKHTKEQMMDEFLNSGKPADEWFANIK